VEQGPLDAGGGLLVHRLAPEGLQEGPGPDGADTSGEVLDELHVGASGEQLGEGAIRAGVDGVGAVERAVDYLDVLHDRSLPP
jgi:hypothetical protein